MLNLLITKSVPPKHTVPARCYRLWNLRYSKCVLATCPLYKVLCLTVSFFRCHVWSPSQAMCLQALCGELTKFLSCISQRASIWGPTPPSIFGRYHWHSDPANSGLRGSVTFSWRLRSETVNDNNKKTPCRQEMTSFRPHKALYFE